MDSIGQYILSIGIAALLASVLTGLTDVKSSTGVLTRMVCGLFLAVTAIEPILDLDFSYLTGFADVYMESAQAASAFGSDLADEARREIIKAKAEAYILDKAGLYDLQLEVEVTLDEGDIPTPESVRLSGSASPYARGRLQELISDELGIPKERQLWTG